MQTARKTVKAAIFDFGGVLAEEGFREGLLAIGKMNGLDPEGFRIVADELIHQTGYVTGLVDESEYWTALRGKTGISGSDEKLREELLGRFMVRPEMLSVVQQLKSCGLILAILSDQTNWLDEINARTPFFQYFQYVFNSYRIRKSKRELSVFSDVCASIGINRDEGLFIDDNPDNVQRAANEGLQVILFRDMESFKKELEQAINVKLPCRQE